MPRAYCYVGLRTATPERTPEYLQGACTFVFAIDFGYIMCARATASAVSVQEKLIVLNT